MRIIWRRKYMSSAFKHDLPNLGDLTSKDTWPKLVEDSTPDGTAAVELNGDPLKKTNYDLTPASDDELMLVEVASQHPDAVTLIDQHLNPAKGLKELLEHPLPELPEEDEELAEILKHPFLYQEIIEQEFIGQNDLIAKIKAAVESGRNEQNTRLLRIVRNLIAIKVFEGT